MAYVDAPSTERPPAAARRRWTVARVAGLSLMALWTLLGLSIVYMLIVGYDPEKVAKYGPRIVQPGERLTFRMALDRAHLFDAETGLSLRAD